MNSVLAHPVVTLPLRVLLVVVLVLTHVHCGREQRESDLPISQQESRHVQSWVREATVLRIELTAQADGMLFRRLRQRLDDFHAAGFSVLWLSSIFPSSSLSQKPTSTDPFPTEDYLTINENFGTLDEFKHLLVEASQRGMRMLIDLQARYTAWDSKLLREHPDWFRTNSEGAIVSPTPELSDVADLNYRHHELRKYMMEVMKYWVREVGVDGFACLDADLVPLEFWIRARKEVEKIKPILLIAQSDRGVIHREAFDATFSFAMSDLLSNTDGASLLEQTLSYETERFPRNARRLRLQRPLSPFPQQSHSAPINTNVQRIAGVLAYTLPGNPVVVASDASLFDPSGTERENFPLYAALAKLRGQYSAVRSGACRVLKLSESSSIIAYERYLPGQSILVLLNNSSEHQPLSIQLPPQFSGTVLEYFSGLSLPTTSGVLKTTCPPYSAKIFVRTSKGTAS